MTELGFIDQIEERKALYGRLCNRISIMDNSEMIEVCKMFKVNIAPKIKK
jgi:hypothetical protein